MPGFASRFVDFLQIQHEGLVQNLGLHADMLTIVYTTTALLIFLGLCFALWTWASSSRRRLPPSPPGKWPIIGHMHLLGPGAPQKSMAQLSEKYCGPLMYLQLGTRPFVVVSSPEMAKEIFKHHDLTFSHRPYLAVFDQIDVMNHGFAWIPNERSPKQHSLQWRKLRKIFTTQLMSSKRRQQSQVIRAEEMKEFLKSILTDVTVNPMAPVKIYSKALKMVVDVLARIMLSKRFKSSDARTAIDPTCSITFEEFENLVDEADSARGRFFVGDYIPWLRWLDIGARKKFAAATHSRMQDFLTTLLNEHRAERRQNGASHVDRDLLDVLLSHQGMEGEDSISEQTVKAVIWDSLEAGTETTLSTLEWAIAHLLQDRQILEKLKTEIDNEVGMHRMVTEDDIPQLKYLQAVINETLRLYPPVPLNLPHKSHEPCTAAGYYIPANTTLHINNWAMGRDPSIWERPQEFFPDRFLHEPLSSIDPVSGQSFELIPFGSGRRMCPAASMGILTAQLLLANIVHAFDLSVPHKIDMEESEERVVVRLATPLQLLMKPRLALEVY